MSSKLGRGNIWFADAAADTFIIHHKLKESPYFFFIRTIGHDDDDGSIMGLLTFFDIFKSMSSPPSVISKLLDWPFDVTVCLFDCTDTVRVARRF